MQLYIEKKFIGVQCQFKSFLDGNLVIFILKVMYKCKLYLSELKYAGLNLKRTRMSELFSEGHEPYSCSSF